MIIQNKTPIGVLFCIILRGCVFQSGTNHIKTAKGLFEGRRKGIDDPSRYSIISIFYNGTISISLAFSYFDQYTNCSGQNMINLTSKYKNICLKI